MFRNCKSMFCGCLLFVLVPSIQAQENIGHVWSKVMNQTVPLGGSISPRSIKLDASGNRCIIGEFIYTADFDPGSGTTNLTSTGSSDIFIAKYDVNGSLIFAKQFGGYYADYAYAIEIDASGNIYLAGSFQGTIDFYPGSPKGSLTSTGSSDFFFAKFTGSGEFVFARAAGGPSDDAARALDLDLSGNLYITGSYIGAVDFDPGSGTQTIQSVSFSQDIFFAKYDANGDFVFAQSLGGTDTEEPASVVVDVNGKIRVAGIFRGTSDFDPGAGTRNLSATGNTDLFLATYDANGLLEQVLQVGGASADIMPSALVLDADGNSVLTGYFMRTVDFDPGAGTVNHSSSSASKDVFLAKYNTAGSLVFAKRMGGYGWDVGNSLYVDGDGNLYLAGCFGDVADMNPDAGTHNLSSVGNLDAFFAKYDGNGEFVFAKQLGGTDMDEGMSLVVDGDGKIVLAGYFKGTADFDPGASTVSLTAPGSVSNVFFATYTTIGDYSYAKQIGTYSNSAYLGSRAEAVATDAAGNVYICGRFYGTVDFDPGSGTANLTSAGSSDIFLAKYDASGNHVFSNAFGSTNSDIGYAVSINSSGQIVLAGSFNGTVDFDPGAGVSNLVSAGNTDIFYAQYDASGNFVYANRIGNSGSDAIARKVFLDNSGNIFISGEFFGAVDFDPGVSTATLTSAGNADVFFAKYDASGNYVFAKRVGGTGWDYANGLAVDGSGNIFLCGSFTGSADMDPDAGTVTLTAFSTSVDLYFAKYDASGAYLFAKKVGSSGTEVADAIAVDGSGNVYMTGYFMSTIDIDPGAGYAGLTSAGGKDIFFAKYNSSGTFVFGKRIGSSGDDQGTDILTDASENVYLAGFFSGTMDVDPGAATVSLTSGANNQDVFLAKFDANAAYTYARQIASGGAEDQVSISLSGNSAILLAGFITGTADFDSGTGEEYRQAWGSGDVYVAKFSTCTSPDVSAVSLYAKDATLNGATILTDGGCRLLSTVEPNGVNPVSGIIQAKVWVETTVPSVSGQPYVARHYEITPATDQPNATARITLYFSQQEFDAYNNDPGSLTNLPTSGADAAGKASLVIRKYDGISSDASGLPDTYAGTPTDIDPVDTDIVWNATAGRWEVSFDVTGFSGFIVQTTLTSLPVSLVDFTAKKLGDLAELSWQTALESKNKGFFVQRSAEGVVFTPIGFVSAKNGGYSQVPQSYNFIDTKPLPGKNLYRLQQVDLDGTMSYSMIRELNFPGQHKLNWYPNPVSTYITLDTGGEILSSVTISLTDVNGRIIRLWNMDELRGLQRLNVSDLTSGYYQILVVDEKGSRFFQRILKQ